MAAFAYVSISGIFASIGGDDEILVLKYLNAEVIERNPKPFFGISDNTNLAVYLWRLGIPSYYGGHVMGQFSMDDKIHSFSKCYLEHAFLHDEEVELKASPDFTDFDFDWSDPEQMGKRRPYESNEGWYWDENGVATGVFFGVVAWRY